MSTSCQGRRLPSALFRMAISVRILSPALYVLPLVGIGDGVEARLLPAASPRMSARRARQVGAAHTGSVRFALPYELREWGVRHGREGLDVWTEGVYE
jgi:hypothetical protein